MKIAHIRIAGVVVGIALGGCGEPADLVPVTPPGAYVPKVSPDADPAQALGETAPAANTGGAADAKSRRCMATKPALASTKGRPRRPREE